MMALPEIWQMWAVFGIVAVGVWFYVRESFSIEVISVGVILALMVFFHLFGAETRLENAQLPVSYTHLTLPTICSV